MPSSAPPHDAPTNSRIGHYVSTVAFDETVRAYVPPPLPPEPPLALSPQLLQRLSEADRAIGRLNGVAMLLGFTLWPRRRTLAGRSRHGCLLPSRP